MPKIIPIGALPIADDMHFPCNGPIEVDAADVVAICATGLAKPHCEEAIAIVAAATPAEPDVLELGSEQTPPVDA